MIKKNTKYVCYGYDHAAEIKIMATKSKDQNEPKTRNRKKKRETDRETYREMEKVLKKTKKANKNKRERNKKI